MGRLKSQEFGALCLTLESPLPYNPPCKHNPTVGGPQHWQTSGANPPVNPMHDTRYWM